VADFFDVRDAGTDQMSFRLVEALFVARRSAAV